MAAGFEVEICISESCSGITVKDVTGFFSAENPFGYNASKVRSADERLAAKVNFLAPTPEYNPSLGSCWQWTGGLNSSGYASIRVDGVTIQLHRYSYERNKGPIPDGMVIDHLCRNRSCCNPAHLEAVTVHENWRRGMNPCAKFARQTHCKRGHPLSGDNLHIIKSTGSRQCKRCKAENAMKLYYANHEVVRAKSRAMERARYARNKKLKEHGQQL